MKKGTNNEWTHNLTNHLMVDLETITRFASMTYIVNIDVYELHPRNGKNLQNILLMNARFDIMHIVGGSLLLKNIYVYLFNDYI